MPSSTQAHSTTPLIVRGPERPDLLRHETLPDIFEATAARLPHKTALIDGASGRSLSYAELEAAADLVAHHLIERGVGPDQIVGLWLPRGLELLIMQLGIAKTGAAWLPFDADVPIDRIAVCLEDASAAGLVVHSDWAAQLEGEPYATWRHTDLQAPVHDTLRRRHGMVPEHTGHMMAVAEQAVASSVLNLLIVGQIT